MTDINLLALQQQADIRSPETLLDHALPKILSNLDDANRIEVFRLARGGMVVWASENSPQNRGQFVLIDTDSRYQQAIEQEKVVVNDDATQVLAPLMTQGEVFALLAISFRSAHTDSLAIISDIADDLGLMLYTKQVETLLRQQIELTGKLAIASSLPDIASIIAETMTLKGQFISVNIFEYENENQLVGARILATANRERSFTADIPLDINFSALEELHHLLLTEGEVLVSDVASDTRFTDEARQWLENQRAKAMYLLPMWIDSQLYAFISLNDVEGGLALADSERELYHNIVHQAASTIEKQHLLERTQRTAQESTEQARTLALINALIAQINQDVDEATILQEMATILLEATGVDHVGVVMRQDDKQAVVVSEAPASGLLGKNIELGADSIHQLLQETNRPFIAEDVAHHPNMPEATRQALLETDIPSIVILPMFDATNRLIGTISLDYFTKQEQIEPTIVELGQTIVSQVALGLQKKRLLDETQLQASQNQRLARNKTQANEIIRKLQEQLDVNDILKVTVQELGKAIGAKKGRIRIGTSPQNLAGEPAND